MSAHKKNEIGIFLKTITNFQKNPFMQVEAEVQGDL